ncbi:MAG: Hsp20/alpha crystallin family protein [Phycisphaerales bacterium]|jgi:HSP20 family protein|nr:Hsp20/alpha crystallin family protein [Phycisphaerales bacterium]MDB5353582.1 Hsp20/alpha crystallin family protein [Phycisphaerales bacterium]
MASRMNALAPLRRLDDMTDVFEDLLSARGFGAAFPGVNIWEDGDNAYIEAELPGVTMDDIEVDVVGDEVMIKGERKIPDEPGGVYRRRERAAGCFSRRVTLPWEVDPDKVEATLQNGVLTIKLPKSEAARPRKVPVKAA